MDKIDLMKRLNGFITEVDKAYPIEFAYLFGSFATVSDNNESDIDIAIMFEKKYSIKQQLIIKGNIIDMGLGYFQRKLDIVLLNNATPLIKYEIVNKGIILKDNKNRLAFESLAIREYFDFSYYAEIYNDAMIKAIKEEA